MKRSISNNLPLKTLAYNAIKEKIINCELKPGSDISEAEIAKELGISRTPVREALLRLNQEKFVVIYPRKGIIVSPITIKDIHELYQIREMIEPYAALNSYKNMKREDLLYFKEKFLNTDFDPSKPSRMLYFNLDVEFHKYIVNSVDNEFLKRFADEIYDLDMRVRVMSTVLVEDIKNRSTPEHIEIIEALLSKDEEKIKESICYHLKSSKQAALMRI